MTKDETAAFLRKLKLETETVVGSVSASNYQALLTIVLADPDEWRTSGETLISAQLTKLDDAYRFLEGEFVFRLKKKNQTLPKDVWDLSRQTATELREFATLLRQTISDVKPEIPSRESLAEMEAHFTSITLAMIKEFLEAFTTLVVSKVTKSQEVERGLVTAAIAQIDHISTSINMISVNASVEAARAGEYGKSFAVIAAEIQSLSQQSKQAIQKIRGDA